MATTDIAGLFVTPEQLQAQQAAQDQARALQFASMTPLQQANFSLFSGGQMLGRGLGRVFGGEDPQLRLISQRQNILRTVNPSDPASLMAGIQMATEAGDQQLAMTLTDFANKQASEIAQARQRTAAAERERQQSVPADIAKAREVGVLTQAIAALEAQPPSPRRDAQLTQLRAQLSFFERPEKITPDMANAAALADLVNADRNSTEWKTTYQQQLTRLTTKPETEKKSAFAQQLEDAGYIPGSPAYVSMMDKFLTKELTAKEDKGPAFGADREAIAAEMFEKPFKDLTKEQKAAVNKRKEEEEGKTAERGATRLVLPGQKEPIDIAKFRTSLTTSLQPYGETLDAADSGIALIDNAIKTNNFASFNSARTELARMLQGGRLSNADVQNAGQNPELLATAKDFLSRTFTGTPSVDTMNDMKKTMQLIRKVAKNKYDRELKAQRNIAKMSNISDEQINTLFEDIRRPEQLPPSNKKAVDFNALPK